MLRDIGTLSHDRQQDLRGILLAMEDGVLPELVGRVLVVKPAEFRQSGISVREIDSDAVALLESVCGRHDRHFDLRDRAGFKGLRIGVRVPERVFGRPLRVHSTVGRPQPALGHHPRCRLNVFRPTIRRLRRLVVELDHEVGIAVGGSGVENELDRPRDLDIPYERRGSKRQYPS